jgi:hypothetical protein
MKFKKDVLVDLSWGIETDGFTLVEDVILDTTRWSIVSKLTFKFEDKFYQTTYSKGATECQDESPFEYEDDEIECKEVFPVVKTITVYE